MKKIAVLLITLLLAIQTFSQQVTQKDAEYVAKVHFYQSYNSFYPNSIKFESIKTQCAFNPSLNDEYQFYVFDINSNQGFVIVSSNYSIKPILAYSLEAGFNHSNMSPAQKEVFNYYNNCLKHVAKENITANPKTLEEWNSLLEYTSNQQFAIKATSPLLLDKIKWNQTWPYNSQCPADANAIQGCNGHVPVGCVATAMLQVMKYYNWPPTGTGSKYHSSWVNGGYAGVSVNFANNNYNWYAIPDAASLENAELGKINYHAGVAVSMHWGPQGSGSQTENIESALKSYFRYPTAKYESKSSYTEATWMSMIKEQIDARKPIVYSGTSTTTGHAWNCDGYQDNTFHMNWGWGGYGDCYCTLDNLISSATAGGAEDNFVNGQQMVRNIYPETPFPTYCSSTTKIITGFEGSFDDGSSNQNYQANQNCTYTIRPTCSQIVQLYFSEFDLGIGDTLKLYAGEINSNILITSFDKNNPPQLDYEYKSNKGALSMIFKTNSTDHKQGWKAYYKTKKCEMNMMHTDLNGSFEDGSGTCDYANSQVCSWIIKPTGNNIEKILLNFENFALAGNNDYVKIYKNRIGSANLVATYKQADRPDTTIVVNDSISVIQFYTDATNTAAGWKINYNTVTSNIINQNAILSDMVISPNPGNDNAKLLFYLAKPTNTRIVLSSVLGEVIATKQAKFNEGYNSLNIKELFNAKQQNGIYLISIQVENTIKTLKFVLIN